MKRTFLISFICLFIDQVIKSFLLKILNVGEGINIINNFFVITLTKNKGAAFSILNSHSFLLIFLACIVLCILLYYIITSKEIKQHEYIIYGFLIGGITGNLFDRIIRGSVVDYLSFNIFGYAFPIFNFADICIVISMFLILILTIKDGKNEVSGRWRN